MGYRLSKIYTRTGDDGTTNFGGTTRLAKTHIAIQAIGDLDELNSAIGVVLTHPPFMADIQERLTQVQHELFNIGGELCTPEFHAIDAAKVSQLEQWIDVWNETLPPLKEFILPGGDPKTAFCHLARAICRRAERALVGLDQQEKINAEILRYVNRLSDVLFVMGRVIGRERGEGEMMWVHGDSA